jgi:flagellar basal-body rod protein FlgF
MVGIAPSACPRRRFRLDSSVLPAGFSMQSGLYVALSGQVALERRLQTIASNVANMNTVGYRADGVSFETQLAKAGDATVAFAGTGSDFISRRTGAISKTDNPLDVAVQGDAWLAIKTPAGTVYTRDGRMTLKESGELTTLNGYSVLDAGGAPLLLDASAGLPEISRDGMVSQKGNQVGALGLYAIDDSAKLTRYNNSGVIPNKPAIPVLDFGANGVAQGFVEDSNVNPIMEMTKLITVTRAFDSIAAATEKSESSLTDAIKTLGSTG